MYATLIQIPTFIRNYVKQGVLASFDSETGEIIVEKNVGCLSDPNPNDNVYQKVLKGIESVTLDENETVEDREEYNIKEGDKIKLIHMTREEYDAEFRHQKQLNYLSFKVDDRDEGVEESFHIIHPDSEDIQKENETTEKKDKLVQKLESNNKNTIPSMTIQFLTILLESVQSATVRAVSEDLDYYLKDFDNVDWDKNDECEEEFGNCVKNPKQYKFLPYSMLKENRQNFIIEFQKVDCLESELILYNVDQPEVNGYKNGWYILKEEKVEEDGKDENDGGEICSILLQLGGGIIIAVVSIISKHVKKYIKRQQRKKKHHISEENSFGVNEREDDDSFKVYKKAPVHKKLNISSSNGKRLWSNLLEKKEIKSKNTSDNQYDKKRKLIELIEEDVEEEQTNKKTIKFK